MVRISKIVTHSWVAVVRIQSLNLFEKLYSWSLKTLSWISLTQTLPDQMQQKVAARDESWASATWVYISFQKISISLKQGATLSSLLCQCSCCKIEQLTRTLVMLTFHSDDSSLGWVGWKGHRYKYNDRDIKWGVVEWATEAVEWSNAFDFARYVKVLSQLLIQIRVKFSFALNWVQ